MIPGKLKSASPKPPGPGVLRSRASPDPSKKKRALASRQPAEKPPSIPPIAKNPIPLSADFVRLCLSEQVEAAATVPNTQLGKSLINRDSIPPLIVIRKEDASNYVSLALLQTNERFAGARTQWPGLALTGSFVGIGFGASLLAIKYFFPSNLKTAILCEREPYAYLLGKILISLMPDHPCPHQLLLNFLNIRLFAEHYIRALGSEDIDSPLFLRQSRQEMLAAIPFEIDYLRRQIFLGESHKVRGEEERLFSTFDQTPETLLEQRAWLEVDWPKRMSFIGRSFFREFVDDYKFFRSISNRLHPLCVDVFHPDLWEFLASQSELGKDPAMFYFSNAAVDSVGSGKRGQLTSTTSAYDESLPKALLRKRSVPAYFAYTRKMGSYNITVSDEIPTREDLLSSFNHR